MSYSTNEILEQEKSFQKGLANFLHRKMSLKIDFFAICKRSDGVGSNLYQKYPNKDLKKMWI